jgi:hypothetical protein
VRTEPKPGESAGTALVFLLLFCLVGAICGMAMFVTGADNQCAKVGGQIDWIGRCHR